MSTVLSTSFNLLDSAIGPLGVQKIVHQNFDIDDYVHTTVIGQAVHLRTIDQISKVNQTLAKNRPPMNIEGAAAGGF